MQIRSRLFDALCIVVQNGVLRGDTLVNLVCVSHQCQQAVDWFFVQQFYDRWQKPTVGKCTLRSEGDWVCYHNGNTHATSKSRPCAYHCGKKTTTKDPLDEWKYVCSQCRKARAGLTKACRSYKLYPYELVHVPRILVNIRKYRLLNVPMMLLRDIQDIAYRKHGGPKGLRQTELKKRQRKIDLQNERRRKLQSLQITSEEKSLYVFRTYVRPELERFQRNGRGGIRRLEKMIQRIREYIHHTQTLKHRAEDANVFIDDDTPVSLYIVDDLCSLNDLLRLLLYRIHQHELLKWVYQQYSSDIRAMLTLYDKNIVFHVAYDCASSDEFTEEWEEKQNHDDDDNVSEYVAVQHAYKVLCSTINHRIYENQPFDLESIVVPSEIPDNKTPEQRQHELYEYLNECGLALRMDWPLCCMFVQFGPATYDNIKRIANRIREVKWLSSYTTYFTEFNARLQDKQSELRRQHGDIRITERTRSILSEDVKRDIMQKYHGPIDDAPQPLYERFQDIIGTKKQKTVSAAKNPRHNSFPFPPGERTCTCGKTIAKECVHKKCRPCCHSITRESASAQHCPRHKQ